MSKTAKPAGPPPVPRALAARPDGGTLIDLLHDTFVTTQWLAARWGYHSNHLSNLRARNAGLPFVRLPGGAIRYRLSDVVAAEIAGTTGAVTLQSVEIAVATLPDLTPEKREQVRRALIEALSSNDDKRAA